MNDCISEFFIRAFAQMLRSARAAAGLTQAEVAAALGMTRTSYTYYELGRSQPPLASLRTLAELLALPPEAFLYPERWEGP